MLKTVHHLHLYPIFQILKDSLKGPLTLVAIVYCIDLLTLIGRHLIPPSLLNYLSSIFPYIIEISIIISATWFIFRVTDRIAQHYWKIAKTNNHPILRILIPLLKNSIKISLLLIFFNSIISYFPLSNNILKLFDHIVKLLLIISISCIFVQITNGISQFLTEYYQKSSLDTFKARKIQTQIFFFKRAILFLIILLSIAAIFISFENLRDVGKNILASAGIIGGLITFSAQKTIGSWFTGLQVALTQPIRLNDTVIVENEFGTIEEINLTYVVVQLWDLRRLILPVNYFLEHPFQNWTRYSSDLLGKVLIYLDPTASIEPIRQEFYEIVKKNPLWNKKTAILQVLDMREHSIEIRILVSADNAIDLHNLCCEIRENLLQFISSTYPHIFPKYRIIENNK